MSFELCQKESGGLRRPSTRGDLFGRQRAVLPKPVALIQARQHEPALRLVERKLLNALLWVAWEDLAIPGENAFAARAADLRRVIGQPGKGGNSGLRDNLARLCQTVQEIRLDGAVVLSAPFLARADLPDGGRIVEWAFHPGLRVLLQDAHTWGAVDLPLTASMTSVYGVALYELLVARVNLRTPYWRVPVVELKELLGVRRKDSGGVWRETVRDWTDFRRRVLTPAVGEVNRLAPFRVRVDEIASQRRIRSVLFTFEARGFPDRGTSQLPIA